MAVFNLEAILKNELPETEMKLKFNYFFKCFVQISEHIFFNTPYDGCFHEVDCSAKANWHKITTVFLVPT